MKRTLLGLLAFVAAFAGYVAKADHTDGGSVGYLLRESQELDQMVRYSYLKYEVKNTVARFSWDVQRLAECEQNVPRTMNRDHDGGCSESCRYQLDQVRRSFYPVERYLRDTYYDFPEVYRQFVSTKRALDAVSVNPGPGPGPVPGNQMVRCIAVDRGFEEHFGGHAAFGRGVYEAQNRAIMQCQQFHGKCRIQSCSPAN